MPKISKEEIIKAVERYKRGETSQKAEAKKQGVSHQTFQDWIRRYETFGSDGFWNTGNRKYPSALKESAVKAYLNGEGSHAEICKRYGISSRTQLQNWIKLYNGHRELRPSRGRLKQSTQNRIADGYFILAAQPVGRENTHSIQHSALWRTHVFNRDHLTLLENTCIHRCSVRIPYHNITLLSCTDQQFVGKKVDIFENDRSAGCL